MLDIFIDTQTFYHSVAFINYDSYFYRLAKQTRQNIATVTEVCKETWLSVVKIKKGLMVYFKKIFFFTSSHKFSWGSQIEKMVFFPYFHKGHVQNRE